MTVDETTTLPWQALPGRILLTGATGRVGARLLPFLKEHDTELRLFVWMPGAATRCGPGNRMVMGDLSDPASCAAAVRNIDAIVHIASAFQGVSGPDAARLNGTATGQLAAAALAAGVRRLIVMSSYLVYDAARAAAGERLAEDGPLLQDPAAPFPAAKLAAEAAVQPYLDSALDVTVLRVAFTYGEGDPHLADALTWASRSAAPDQLTHLVHHADVRQGILAALRCPQSRGRTYNLADDEPVAARDLVRIGADFTGRGADPGGESEDGAVLGCILNTEAAGRDLGFRPEFPSIRDAAARGLM